MTGRSCSTTLWTIFGPTWWSKPLSFESFLLRLIISKIMLIVYGYEKGWLTGSEAIYFKVNVLRSCFSRYSANMVDVLRRFWEMSHSDHWSGIWKGPQRGLTGPCKDWIEFAPFFFPSGGTCTSDAPKEWCLWLQTLVTKTQNPYLPQMFVFNYTDLGLLLWCHAWGFWFHSWQWWHSNVLVAKSHTCHIDLSQVFYKVNMLYKNFYP